MLPWLPFRDPRRPFQSRPLFPKKLPIASPAPPKPSQNHPFSLVFTIFLSPLWTPPGRSQDAPQPLPRRLPRQPPSALPSPGSSRTHFHTRAMTAAYTREARQPPSAFPSPGASRTHFHTRAMTAAHTREAPKAAPPAAPPGTSPGELPRSAATRPSFLPGLPGRIFTHAP